ncbi:22700_t:CDS:2, partial [Gigaspora rosea]
SGITTCEYVTASLYSGKRFPTWEACESHLYDSTSNKDTKTKKTQCPFPVNTSCPKVNNSENSIVVNKIVYEHNYPLNRELIVFEDGKKFIDSMLED